MKRILTIATAGVVAITVAACGTQVNGYANAEEGCRAEGTGVILKGPIKEADETEYYCQAAEGNKNLAIIIEQSVQHKQDNVPNSWLADEDNMIDLSTGQEVPRKSPEQLQQDWQETDTYETE